MSPATRRRTVRLSLLLAVWYISSLLTSLSTKEILRVFPYPITLAAVQQVIAATFGWASLRGAGRSRLAMLRDGPLHLLTLPIATVMVIALAAYRWALMMSSVSFVHTVKTLGPLFTILFSRLLLDERLAATRYLSVTPVVLGVALTSITEAEFTMAGFLAILLSTAGQALQSVAAKRLLREREVGKGEVRARGRVPPAHESHARCRRHARWHPFGRRQAGALRHALSRAIASSPPARRARVA